MTFTQTHTHTHFISVKEHHDQKQLKGETGLFWCTNPDSPSRQIRYGKVVKAW